MKMSCTLPRRLFLKSPEWHIANYTWEIQSVPLRNPFEWPLNTSYYTTRRKSSGVWQVGGHCRRGFVSSQRCDLEIDVSGNEAWRVPRTQAAKLRQFDKVVATSVNLHVCWLSIVTSRNSHIYVVWTHFSLTRKPFPRYPLLIKPLDSSNQW